MKASMESEFTLVHGQQRAVVSSYGASLRRYFDLDTYGKETDLAWGYSGGSSHKKGGQGDVLIPFPSRIPHGRYTFEGVTYQIPCNDKEGDAAIHGFLRSQTWKAEQASPSEIRFLYSMRAQDYAAQGYPFDVDVEVHYSLGRDGLEVSYKAKNTGNKTAPFGIGFHPYFLAGSVWIDDASVRLPVHQHLEFGPGFIPTGKLLSSPEAGMDFTKLREVGQTQFNHCFTGIIPDSDGMARSILVNPKTGRKITLWMDDSFRYLVVYTGDAIEPPYGRKSLAIEPMTCATNAFNHPEWGLIQLKPGQSCSGRFGVQYQLGGK